MNYLQDFHVQISGQSRRGRLVFLHGLMGAGANWRKIVSHFSDDFEVLTFDQRGHGRSIQPPVEDGHGYRPEDFADDLRGILDTLGWPEVYLVGHSMGGRNALNFAARFPQRVIKLVIEDIGPDANPQALVAIEKLLNLVPTPFASKKVARQFFLDEYPVRIAYHPQARVLSQYFYTNIEEKPDGTADWRFSREGILACLRQGRLQDRWEEYRSLQMPTLVVRGENSTDLSRDVFDRMARELPGVKAVEIANSGHWVHFDQPQAFISALSEFLRDQDV